MSEMGELYRQIREKRQKKRRQNLEYSTEKLKQLNIEFESKNNGVHLVIKSEPVIDFYPSTGLWIERETKHSKRGILSLLRHLGIKN